MKAFSEILDEINIKEDDPLFYNKNVDLLLTSMNKENKLLDDIKIILSTAARENLTFLREKAEKLTRIHFGKNIQLYIPIYLSSECINSCIYCGFNLKRKIPRKTLSFEEAEREFERIAKTGMKHILLLTGEAPEVVDISYLERMIKLALKYFPQISLEIYPLDTERYKRLVDSGATGLYIYQETYNKNLYAKYHPYGPKSNFEFRLEAPERAAEAGFKFVGIGILLGLDFWKRDFIFLLLHATYLMKKFWQTDIGLSFPRIIPPENSNFIPPYSVSEKELEHMIYATRIILENVGISLSTRENAYFRNKMIGYGVTRMSAGSKTNPGGYTLSDENSTGGQFDVCDRRSIPEVINSIIEKGYYPVFKDWELSFNSVAEESI
jgi:2-iminoacetate synthase